MNDLEQIRQAYDELEVMMQQILPHLTKLERYVIREKLEALGHAVAWAEREDQ